MAQHLVLTTSDSGAGHLKSIGRGDKVIALQHRLVRDPVPPLADISAFFAERQSLHRLDAAQFGSWLSYDEGFTGPEFDDLKVRWHKCELVEFWTEPSPNSQLILIQVLDWAKRQGLPFEKLMLVNASSRLGDRQPDDQRSLKPTPVQAEDRHLDLAVKAWAAFRKPTPESWANLLADNLDGLTFLRSTVLRMLKELPSKDTGLAASEVQILNLARSGTVEVAAILSAIGGQREISMLDYWEVGKAIDLLTRGPKAALVGLRDGPFDMALHDHGERLKRYTRSNLSLSPFGEALIDRRADFPSGGRIDRWWGGTKLTNDNCWRWSSTERMLSKPS